MPIDADGAAAGPPRQVTRELADSISWAGADRLLYMATDRLKLVSVADGDDARRPTRSDVAAARSRPAASSCTPGV